MKNIRMKLSYDGSRYSGWQKLGDDDNTIQGKLEDLLSKMAGEKINVVGCSRTDKGVHAKALVCNFFTEYHENSALIEEYINRYLPDDIVAYDLEEVDERFHSRYNAKSKLYRYTIDNQKYQDVFTRRYTSHIPDHLDLNMMQEAANFLVGKHDFQAFTTLKSKKKSTIKTIIDIKITRNGKYVYLDYEGDGFLYNMIRIITGTLVRVGKGELTPSEMLNILESKNRSMSGPMAEPKGLCLYEVRF